MHETLTLRNVASSVEHFKSPAILLQAFEARSCNLISKVYKIFTESKLPNKVKENELFQQKKLLMTREHIKCVQATIFYDKITKTPIKDPKVKQHLLLLFTIYALDDLLQNAISCYDTGFFAAGSLRNMQIAMNESVEALRP